MLDNLIKRYCNLLLKSVPAFIGGASLILLGCGETTPRPIDYNKVDNISFKFSDTDKTKNTVSGPLTLNLKGNQIEGVTQYSLYWSSKRPASSNKVRTASQISGITKIADIPKSNDSKIHTFENERVQGKYILLFLNQGAKKEPVYSNLGVMVEDIYDPSILKGDLSFEDQDPTKQKIAGELKISVTPDFETYSKVLISWSKDGKTKGKTLKELRKSNASQVLIDFPKATDLEAEYLHLQTENKFGVSKEALSLKIKDLGVPKDPMVNISFSDQNEKANQIEGNLVLSSKIEQDDFKEYLLFWGDDESKLEKEPFAKIARESISEKKLYHFSAKDKIKANKVFLYLSNDDGKNLKPVSTKIIDLIANKPPKEIKGVLSINDQDPDAGEIQGTVKISPVPQNKDFTSYLLYWGKSAKKPGKMFARVSRSQANQAEVFTFPENTKIAGKYLFLNVENKFGKSKSFISTKIKDLKLIPPLNPKGKISFTDKDDRKDKIAGDLKISPLPKAKDFTHYSLYWGKDSLNNLEEIVKISRLDVENGIVYNFMKGTDKQSDFITLKLSNPYGTSERGISLKINDKGSTSTIIPLVFKHVNFPFDRAELSREYKEMLKSIIARNDNPEELKLLVTGHCDERGSTAYNLVLGERRALAVKKYLIALGVPAENIETISYGEERPLDPAHNRAAWAKNRRAETTVKK